MFSNDILNSTRTYNCKIMDNSLTPKQEAFCQAYIQTGNKSEAYRMSYNCSKMKPETIHVKANELFNIGKVSVRVEELQSEVAERNQITVDELIQSLSGMVRFDVAELYNEDGSLKSIHEIPKEARMMISEVESIDLRDLGVVRKVKTIRKLDAIEKLMKHLGGYEKDNSQKQPVVNTVPDLSNLSIEELQLLKKITTKKSDEQ